MGPITAQGGRFSTIFLRNAFTHFQMPFLPPLSSDRAGRRYHHRNYPIYFYFSYFFPPRAALISSFSLEKEASSLPERSGAKGTRPSQHELSFTRTTM